VTAYSPIEIGAVLAGKYRMDRVLGQGGMGIVVQAMHLQLHQPVAMKFLLPEVLGNQQVVQRFLREAQAAVRLRSEHVARVIDVGTLETGAPYMVLEYLEGTDLSNFPRSQLTVGMVVDLMLQACEALAEAHSLGIVHRDIKPANFFITRSADGTLLLKVLDFGISKSPAMSSQLTATQAVMGTPAYMSPEQMRSSRDVDHRSDIWSLGIVLYELLQGAPPFGGDTFSSMVLTVVNGPLPKLTVRLPSDLEAIVYRCLEKDPARRFQNTAELAQALANYAQSETQAAITVQRTRAIVGSQTFPPAPHPGPGGRVPSTLTGAAGARTSSSPRSRRWPALAVMGVVIVGTVVVLTAARGGGEADRSSPSAQPEGSSKALPAVPPDRIEKPSPPKPSSQPAATGTTSPPPPVATSPASPLPVTAPPPNPVMTTPPPSPGSAMTAAGSTGAPAQATSPPAAQAPPTSSEDATIPSNTVAKKRKKATNTPVTSTKPGNPSTNPSQPAEDGVLDSRK
jgi:serine/threonine protein kinase